MLDRPNPCLWAARPGRIALALAVAFWATQAANAQIETPPQTLIINQQLSKAWADVEIKPSAKVTDDQFVRRAFIDLIGRIPSAEEVREFEAEHTANKRGRLVHRLLHETKYKPRDLTTGRPVPSPSDPKKELVIDYTEEYAKHWANIWGVWLMTRGGVNNVYHEQMKVWLEEAFAKNMPHDEFVRALLTASGANKDNAAVNFVAAHLGEGSPADKRITDGPFDAVPITSRVTKLFLGIQVQCTQCHDHPFNPEWKQENFWGVNAYFRQVSRDKPPTPPDALIKKKDKGMIATFTVSDDPNLNPSKLVFFELRSGTLRTLQPVFLPDLADLGAEKPSKPKKLLPAESQGKSRRQALADYVINHDNFAKAYVNRMWAHFFGRGMNELPAADDFGGHNKVVHPELLDKLAEEFVKYKYDPKALMEWICNSDAYQLSHVANESNKKVEKEPYFSRMLLKAMSPEVMFESMMEATKADYNQSVRDDLRERFLGKLVRNFGDDEGNEVTFNGTIVQALMMMNGEELNQAITAKGAGTVDRALKKYTQGKGAVNEKAVLDEIYLSALARRPSAAATVEVHGTKIDPRTKKEVALPPTKLSEVQVLTEALANAKKTNPDFGKDPIEGYRKFYEDVLWTLLNTSEFILNH